MPPNKACVRVSIPNYLTEVNTVFPRRVPADEPTATDDRPPRTRLKK